MATTGPPMSVAGPMGRGPAAARAERVPPNTVTFASAIAACAQAGEWERALKLLDTCFATGTPRNTIVYSSAISACEKAGEWRPALDLIARMEGDGIAPDATALNAAMAAGRQR